ncbi:MAG: hypothetical protein ABI844_17620 [Saprospiraceae bacterium]
MFINILEGIAQNDCLYGSFDKYIETINNVIVFKVDRLIYDSLQLRNQDVYGLKKSRIASGRILKDFKYPFKVYCNNIIVEWDLIFEPNRVFLLFGDIANDKLYIDSCSFSEPVSNSKSFKKLYSKVLKYFSRKEIDQLLK